CENEKCSLFTLVRTISPARVLARNLLTLFTVVMLVGSSVTAAQERETTQDSAERRVPSDQQGIVDSLIFLKRPKSLNSLKEFVARRFGVDLAQIEDALADNNPAVVFTVFMEDRRIDHLLIDEGNRIVHHIHSLRRSQTDGLDRDNRHSEPQR